MNKNKMLILENGLVFEGYGFGSSQRKIAEIVFNTSMVGYQEILSDPSYQGQMVLMTYPLIGNYGLNDDDFESKGIYMSGMICREYNNLPSNFRFTKTLDDCMEESGVPGIYGVDTRMITRVIRNEGSMKAMICDINEDIEEMMELIKQYEIDKYPVKTVSTKKVWYSRTKNPNYNVVVIDCGVKLNIVKSLNKNKCNCIVVPYNTSVEDILKYKPDGLYISNGPGDPENVTEVIDTIKYFKGKLPICGICLGHQMISIAYGAKTYKMKFGHRGANHPVKNLLTGKVEITSQNHSYAIDSKTLEGTGLKLAFINLLDGEVEGVINEDIQTLSIQYHPESAAGPEDSDYLFGWFTKYMQDNKKKLAVGGNK